MSKKDKAYHWWKRRPHSVRKPLVFILGVLLVCIAPLVGWIPGPGGIAVFLAGIGILATEFDWAESLKSFFLHKVPKEVKKRWRPTPKWELTFDITALLMLAAALVCAYKSIWAPVISLAIGAICLLFFNRGRVEKIKQRLRKNRR